MADRKVLKAWADGVALQGPNAPKNTGQIEHLIEYLLTVYERFGNTRITVDADLQWGATAMYKQDDLRARIATLEADVAHRTTESDKWLGLLVELRALLSDTGMDECEPGSFADKLYKRIHKAIRARSAKPSGEPDAETGGGNG